MIQIDPKITQIPGFNEDCLWLICTLVQSKTPTSADLEISTGWSQDKIRKVANLLVKLDLLQKTPRFSADGGQLSNEYKINTKLINLL